jgi:hypothetical protein
VTIQPVSQPISPLRRRMLDDMAMRGMREATQRDYILQNFAAFLKRPPDTATTEEIRRFQVYQAESGVQPPTINCSVSALRFSFTVTLDRPDLSRRLVLIRHPRRIRCGGSVLETGHKHQRPFGSRGWWIAARLCIAMKAANWPPGNAAPHVRRPAPMRHWFDRCCRIAHVIAAPAMPTNPRLRRRHSPGP